MATGKEWNTLLKDLMPSTCDNPVRYIPRVTTGYGTIWQIGSERDENSYWKFVSSNDSAIEALKKAYSYWDSDTQRHVSVPGKSRAISWSDISYIVTESRYFNSASAFYPISNDAALPENFRSSRFKDLVGQKKIDYSTYSGGKLSMGTQFKTVGFGDDLINKSDGMFDFKICNDQFLCLENRRDSVVLIGAWDHVAVFDVR